MWHGGAHPAGDDDGFAAFVAGRSQALLSTAYLLTRDWGRAEDIVQQALARSWVAWRSIKGPPEPYVRKVLLNEYLGWRRRRWRHELPSEDVPDPPGAPDPASGIDARDAVWRLLGRLTAQQRAVIVLRYYEDLSEREIADVLGCSPGAVKSHAARAMATLRATLIESAARGVTF
jgi:RNA polymerase sigma-70 factor (sigma-E family)